MARFEFLEHELEAVKARALSLKPMAENVIATVRGWEKDLGDRGRELLVSFAGLDKLFGDTSESAVEADATAPVDTPAPVVAPVSTEGVDQVSTETVTDTAPVEVTSDVAAADVADSTSDTSAPKKTRKSRKTADATATTADSTDPVITPDVATADITGAETSAPVEVAQDATVTADVATAPDIATQDTTATA